MTLPTLKTLTYTTPLPSTGKAVEFRSFLVREEKILLLAQESNDVSVAIKAIKDIIDSCTLNKLDIESLTNYDIEYLFLQIRIKSNGPEHQLKVKCPKCGAINTIEIDLNEAELVIPDPVDNKVILSGDIGITLRVPSIDDAAKISDRTEDFTKTLALCIDTIFDNESVTSRKDVSSKELEAFIESFSREHVEKIEKYISSQPSIQYNDTVKCTECGEDIEIKLYGLQDFFN